MSEREPTLHDVLAAVGELRGEVGELRGVVETLGREVRAQRKELPGAVAGIVVAAIERTTYATDLRILQADVAELKAAGQ